MYIFNLIFLIIFFLNVTLYIQQNRFWCVESLNSSNKNRDLDDKNKYINPTYFRFEKFLGKMATSSHYDVNADFTVCPVCLDNIRFVIIVYQPTSSLHARTLTQPLDFPAQCVAFLYQHPEFCANIQLKIGRADSRRIRS